VSSISYDEFGMLHENAADFNIPFDRPPVVRRVPTDVGAGRRLSSIVWGSRSPELVFFHGGAQNAHTWDTLALMLDRPLLAVDLPGHGHSDAGRNGSFTMPENAADLALVVTELAPEAGCVIGMSLGGLLALTMADAAPHLVRRLMLVDITPGVNDELSKDISSFVNGQESYDSFEEMLARTVEFYPTRTPTSLRRGILHNAVERPDGRWVWRHTQHSNDEPKVPTDYSSLWATLSRLAIPVALVRGMRASSVVSDADEDEFVRVARRGRVVRVDAGHGIQGEAPAELARLIGEFSRSSV
jgi:pimeloyl-ACP methyl ester carboxylesterase